MDSVQAKRTRELRRRSTDAERKLWRLLRDRQIDGVKFRRQHKVGRYIADFISFGARLILEVDGGQHASALAADKVRADWLESQGYRIIRFWNNEVLANPEGVVTLIRRALGTASE
jgi:very-short-patch-repair endonuclease